MAPKSYRQMLMTVRWLTIKAALLQSFGLFLLVIAILPLVLLAYMKEPSGMITLSLAFLLFCGLVTGLYYMIKGMIDAYSYGCKSEEFIRRFYEALIKTGNIKRS